MPFPPNNRNEFKSAGWAKPSRPELKISKIPEIGEEEKNSLLGKWLQYTTAITNRAIARMEQKASGRAGGSYNVVTFAPTEIAMQSPTATGSNLGVAISTIRPKDKDRQTSVENTRKALKLLNYSPAPLPYAEFSKQQDSPFSKLSEVRNSPHLALPLAHDEKTTRYTRQFNSDLETAIEKNPPTQETAINYIQGMIAGLAVLHKHNLIHGDVKPLNALVGPNDEVVLSDLLDTLTPVDEKGHKMSIDPGTGKPIPAKDYNYTFTLEYAAPELYKETYSADGKRIISPLTDKEYVEVNLLKADVYSLAESMYEILIKSPTPKSQAEVEVRENLFELIETMKQDPEKRPTMEKVQEEFVKYNHLRDDHFSELTIARAQSSDLYSAKGGFSKPLKQEGDMSNLSPIEHIIDKVEKAANASHRISDPTEWKSPHDRLLAVEPTLRYLNDLITAIDEQLKGSLGEQDKDDLLKLKSEAAAEKERVSEMRPTIQAAVSQDKSLQQQKSNLSAISKKLDTKTLPPLDMLKELRNLNPYLLKKALIAANQQVPPSTGFGLFNHLRKKTNDIDELTRLLSNPDTNKAAIEGGLQKILNNGTSKFTAALKEAATAQLTRFVKAQLEGLKDVKDETPKPAPLETKGEEPDTSSHFGSPGH